METVCEREEGVLGRDSRPNCENRLGDIINDWRKARDLEPVPTTEGPNLAETLKIPFTYCWSPSLVPKPFDWPAHIGETSPAGSWDWY